MVWGKSKILLICCSCCPGKVGREESVTGTGGKAQLSHSSRALIELCPKCFIPGHTESLNGVNEASSVSEEREGLVSPANAALQVRKSSGGLVSV